MFERLDRHEAELRRRIRTLFDAVATWKPAEDGSFLPLAELLKELSCELWTAGYAKQLAATQDDFGDIDLPQMFAVIHLAQINGIAPEIVAEKLRPDAEAYGLHEMQMHWLRIARQLGFDAPSAGASDSDASNYGSIEERDAEWLEEWRRDESLHGSKSAFARHKGVDRSTMSKALNRAEKRERRA